MRVREAIESDRAAYWRLVQAFHAAGKFPFALDAARQNAMFEVVAMEGRGKLWIVEADGRAAGFLMATSRVSPLSGEVIAQENMLWVDPEARRGGKAADSLMGAFLDWGRSIGADCINASAQASMRPRATARFFRRHGLTETETHFARRL